MPSASRYTSPRERPSLDDSFSINWRCDGSSITVIKTFRLSAGRRGRPRVAVIFFACCSPPAFPSIPAMRLRIEHGNKYIYAACKQTPSLPDGASSGQLCNSQTKTCAARDASLPMVTANVAQHSRSIGRLLTRTIVLVRRHSSFRLRWNRHSPCRVIYLGPARRAFPHKSPSQAGTVVQHLGSIKARTERAPILLSSD